MLLDIVILPPPKIRTAVAKLTKQVADKYQLKWRVDNKRLIPHITLFHVLIRDSDLPKILIASEGLVKQQKPFTLTFSEVEGGKLSFGMSLKRTKPLYDFHKQVITSFNKFRSGMTASKFTTPLRFLTKKDKYYLRKFGVAWILSDFWPHITLAMLKNPNELSSVLVYANRFQFPRFRTDTLAVTKINKYFQVTKILQTFKLK